MPSVAIDCCAVGSRTLNVFSLALLVIRRSSKIFLATCYLFVLIGRVTTFDREPSDHGGITALQAPPSPPTTIGIADSGESKTLIGRSLFSVLGSALESFRVPLVDPWRSTQRSALWSFRTDTVRLVPSSSQPS